MATITEITENLAKYTILHTFLEFAKANAPIITLSAQ